MCLFCRIPNSFKVASFFFIKFPPLASIPSEETVFWNSDAAYKLKFLRLPTVWAHQPSPTNIIDASAEQIFTGGLCKAEARWSHNVLCRSKVICSCLFIHTLGRFSDLISYTNVARQIQIFLHECFQMVQILPIKEDSERSRFFEYTTMVFCYHRIIFHDTVNYNWEAKQLPSPHFETCVTPNFLSYKFKIMQRLRRHFLY